MALPLCLIVTSCSPPAQGSSKKALSAEEARARAEELVRKAKEKREREERELEAHREREVRGGVWRGLSVSSLFMGHREREGGGSGGCGGWGRGGRHTGNGR